MCKRQAFPDGRVILLLVNIEQSGEGAPLKNVIEIRLDIEGFQSPLQDCRELRLCLQRWHLYLCASEPFALGDYPLVSSRVR